jgi:hypothetical protein
MEALINPALADLQSGLIDEYFDKLADQNKLDGERANKIFMEIIGNKENDGGVPDNQVPDPRPVVSLWRRSSGLIRWSVAASLTGIMLVTGYFWTKSARQEKFKEPLGYMPHNMAGKINISERPTQYRLEDGSIVDLQPGSTLYYPAHFSKDKREVYLDGEAFFTIGKHRDWPFLVYNRNLITRVLGTSFYMKTDKVRKLVEVSVVTGKVQVFEIRDSSISEHDKKSKGVILVPNEKVIYKEEDRHFMTMLVNNPVPVNPEGSTTDTSQQRFRFRETPLSDVLKLLEDTYGIQIISENDKISKSLFTGDIGTYDLYSKLDIICQSQNVSYEIVGTKIIIK